ncbi:hypothetical protein [Christiangramia sp.]|uniref:hypothetical protein n=1 Tax=Christiangramia sp. TaxID=1931228 RepID=UPI00345B5B99
MVPLAITLAVHNRKGLPIFGIYGKDFQGLSERSILEDVKDKWAGLAVALMKGKLYLAIGSVFMGIIGSEINSDFFQEFLE